jgi:2,4-dienoyl-CoA reductase-like NADH-dependent reductase (Old Yellow Enzyme family)
MTPKKSKVSKDVRVRPHVGWGGGMKQLFEESGINDLVLSNRFVRSATWDGLATDDGSCTARMINLMVDLADGGVGLIITGHAYVHPHGQHSPWQLGVYKDGLIQGLQAMAAAVHEKNGKIVMQLGYGGAYLSKSRVRAMTVQHFRDIQEAFGRAALRAKKAGFDGVQIFAAHGFFLSQLLCPRYNDRTDAYGGSIENRARALMEVLQHVRNAVGPNYPVLAKLNARDFVENGLTLEDSLRVAIMLEKEGIDAIELSGGLLNNPNLMKSRINTEEDEAYFREEARAFKRELSVPLILVGGIRSFHVAKELLEEGVADYVSLCRPFIREPHLINRWKSGDLRKATCTSCNNCFEQAKKGEGISCVPLEESKNETFFPQLSETIPASPPHPPGTNYRISIGIERVDSGFLPVIKVQMIFQGEVSERSPSFPLGTEDHLRVGKTINDLLQKHLSIIAEK